MSEKIKKNAAKCSTCGEIIESKHRHDFVVHRCGLDTDWRFAVDGGKEYIRRVGGGFVDVSEYYDET